MAETLDTSVLSTEPLERIQHLLVQLYGEPEGEKAFRQLTPRLDEYARRFSAQRRDVSGTTGPLTEADAILITYGDQFQGDAPPLQLLEQFLDRHLGQIIRGVHILPFYPYSSDDGFSVIDYRQVNPALGSWDDIRRLAHRRRLMFDAVVNHISQHSRWFQGFLQQEPPYDDYFITVDPAVDLSAVVRPRALPLLTPVETVRGQRYVWTTFSEDQIDLNYANPQVLLEMLDIILFYAVNGAQLIRLDAIAYLWKEIGTPCIHLENTHNVVRLIRAVLDAVAPHVLLITETNVPHEENISYFGRPLPGGDLTDEAQLVYQFPLAPLILHTFVTGSASVLSRWAAGLKTPSPGTAFFNFIASHDGIGLRPSEGLLSPAEIQALIDRTLSHGGQVSYRYHPDGSRSVYELNITLYDLLNDPSQPDPDVDIQRFLASQAIMLALAGVPGIYIHSLFGSSSCHSCYQETGRARSLNRQKFQLAELEARLSQPDSREARVFTAYRHMLATRSGLPAFHPAAAQQVLNLHDGFFALLRTPQDRHKPVLCLTSVTPAETSLQVDLHEPGIDSITAWQDALTGRIFRAHNSRLQVSVAGYETLWLKSLESA